MLQHLKVKNYALISDVEIQFSDGLNIITGETGAGKSILVGALGMVLGNRADTTALRNKDQKCIVEGSFNIAKYDLKQFFDTNDLDFEIVTIIRREITSSGKSRAFINDTPTTLKVLSRLGAKLVEIHSQRDNLQLFNTNFQYHSLDILAGCSSQRQTYEQELKRLTALKTQHGELVAKEVELSKEVDYNNYLFNELDAAELEEANEQELSTELEMLENAEDLISTFNEANQVLEGTEYAAVAQLYTLEQLLRKSRTVQTDELSERISSVLIELKDISSEIENAAQQVEINPMRLEEVSERVALLHSLKQKHRVETVDELIAIKEQLSLKLENTLGLEMQIEKLVAEITTLEEYLIKLARDISSIRKLKATEIADELNAVLIDLGMEHSRIKYELEGSTELNNYGMNSLSIALSSDKGNSYSDIKKAASGGELARINLSLKNLLANHLEMPSSIYDEIDTGVSGEVARKVGLLMKAMSQEQQVITITHLPQIASLGDHHLFVYKSESDTDIETQVKLLKGKDRISEIAKMISGDNLTEHALEQSKELLKD